VSSRSAALIAGCIVFLVTAPAFAVQPDEVLKDPRLEARARQISTGLRCLVCQNQSIDDSDAPLARDLRLLVRERLQVGDSDDQVIDFVVSRYGEFVLLKPRLRSHTWLLWFATPVLFLLAMLLIFLSYRRRSRVPRTKAEAPLTRAEEAKLNKLLDRG